MEEKDEVDVMNKTKKPWYIWLSVFAFMYLFCATLLHFKFLKLSEGDNLEKWFKAVLHLSLAFLCLFGPLFALSPLLSWILSRLEEGTNMHEAVGFLAFIILYFSGVYATYRHYIWRKNNLKTTPESESQD